VSSFIYRNDSKDGQIKFVDVSSQVAKELANIGLVCDALFTDFDSDGWPDMVLAGEWMPLTFLKNEKGIFRNVTNSTGISDQSGWWNSLTAGDFDNNGSYDAIPALFLKASQDDTSRKQFAVPGRDDMVKQIIGMRSKFQNYKSYATTTIDQLFTPEQSNGSLRLNANNFNSSFCRNDGDGKFTLVALPLKAQLSALNGMVTDDFDGDGNLDVVINTNDYGTDVSLGRYDALNGLMLKGDGRGNFIAQSIMESGIYIPGNGKALIKLKGKNNKYLLAATQNRGPLAVFQLKKDCNHIALQPADVTIDISFKDGKKQKQECYYGTSFLSQSARFLQVSKNVESAVITDGKGQTRTLTF